MPFTGFLYERAGELESLLLKWMDGMPNLMPQLY
jgi:hypothetical protein